MCQGLHMCINGYCTQIVSRKGVFCKKTRVTSALMQFIEFVCINCCWNEVRVNGNTINAKCNQCWKEVVVFLYYKSYNIHMERRCILGKLLQMCKSTKQIPKNICQRMGGANYE